MLDCLFNHFRNDSDPRWPDGVMGFAEFDRLERTVEGKALNPRAYSKACDLVGADSSIGMEREQVADFYDLPAAHGQLERAFVRAQLAQPSDDVHRPDWTSPMATWPRNQWKQPMAGTPTNSQLADMPASVTEPPRARQRSGGGVHQHSEDHDVRTKTASSSYTQTGFGTPLVKPQLPKAKAPAGILRGGKTESAASKCRRRPKDGTLATGIPSRYTSTRSSTIRANHTQERLAARREQAERSAINARHACARQRKDSQNSKWLVNGPGRGPSPAPATPLQKTAAARAARLAAERQEMRAEVKSGKVDLEGLHLRAKAAGFSSEALSATNAVNTPVSSPEEAVIELLLKAKPAHSWAEAAQRRPRLPIKGGKDGAAVSASEANSSLSAKSIGRQERKELMDLRQAQLDLASRVANAASELATQRRAHRLAVAEAQNAQLLERLNAVANAANAVLPPEVPVHFRKELLPSQPDRRVSLPLPLDALLPRATWPAAAKPLTDTALLLTFGQ
eukprot:SAG31_NODE_3028_length_4768_cov_5.420433_2_plen_508_part_00